VSRRISVPGPVTTPGGQLPRQINAAMAQMAGSLVDPANVACHAHPNTMTGELVVR